MKKIEPSPWARADSVRTPFVRERFVLSPASKARVRAATWSFGFGAFSEVVYHDNYAKEMSDGRLEAWPDTIIRVVEGVFSIRKDHYVRNRIAWDEGRWQEVGEEMSLFFLSLKCGPPGRGYSMMGTPLVYARGSAVLYNCAATKVGVRTLDQDMAWAMDMLMCGSGVGFECLPLAYDLSEPSGRPSLYVIPDTREGWVESVQILLASFMGKCCSIKFDYSKIRPAGMPIRGFGGTSSGPESLRELHERIRMACGKYIADDGYGASRLVADVANAIGCCVVSGNIRRSSEILIGSPDDSTFLDLKDYEKYPERQQWGWASNNSLRLSESRHFKRIPEIAAWMRENGEPGIFNLIAARRFGRFGREKSDRADLVNPCGEIPLEDKEVCNLAEVYPSRCRDSKEVIRAAEIACFYASTVSLLPTHRPETNAMIARNRRIGVGVSGVADWGAVESEADITWTLRRAYESVIVENARLATEAGVPASVRCTTVKPSGTVSLLAGVAPGGHFALGRFYIRRKRVSVYSPFVKALDAAGYPHEVDGDSADTLVYEFPQAQSGRTQAEAGMWEQALRLCMLQREWSDNAVSFTIDFDSGEEGPTLQNCLAMVAPMVKSVSALPRTHGYALPPYEEISEREYRLRCKMVRVIDWSRWKREGTGEADKYCSKPVCDLSGPIVRGRPAR